MNPLHPGKILGAISSMAKLSTNPPPRKNEPHPLKIACKAI
jgi:hypothetical protein